MSNPASEPVCVIVLTKDEQANIGDCLDAVLAQLREGDEIVVIDSASRDATVSLVEGYVKAHQGKIRMHGFPENVTFGAARNTGIAMTVCDIVVFVSADAIPRAGWLEALRSAARNADIVYGRQQHAPVHPNAVTVSRGLRYHHFENDSEALPETFASNVNAAYRRFAFESLPFDDEMPGSEDVAFARSARLAGLRIAYARHAVVDHKDVASWKGEWRKHLREGAARAMRADLLGVPTMHLAWATSVGLAAIAAVVLASFWLLALCILLFFAPTLRRVASPMARRYRPPQLVAGATASPFFDLAFVGSYLARRVRRS